MIYIITGSTAQKITNNGHNRSAIFNLMKNKGFNRGDTERLMREMVIDGTLREDLFIGHMDQAISYCKVGPKAFDVLSGRRKVMSMSVHTKHFMLILKSSVSIKWCNCCTRVPFWSRCP